jgi:hypothetical protein
MRISNRQEAQTDTHGMKLSFRWLVVLGFCLLWVSVRAAELAVGDAVPSFSATDQHGMKFVFTNGTQFLLVVTERACGTSANHKLADQGAGFLEKHHAVYVMDIHAMPFVARLFALPTMRKYPQRIVLVDSAETLAWVPVQPGRVTVLTLTQAGRIQKISYWNPDSEPVAGYLQ